MDYGASLSQRVASPHSMPRDPLLSISWGMIYDPANSPVLYVLVSVVDYGIHKWWCVGVREVPDTDVSSFKVQLEFYNASE